ncbi:MAG: YccF domain-containing protein [Eubacterium sp.]|nr:YccF domain-containing protein [Eubacterium sp.]
MSLLGNILWLICGGICSGLSWLIAGVLCCITIVGIPIGMQCFKFAALGFCPFGKDVEYGNGTVSVLANIVWLIVIGIPMAIGHATAGLCLCITIIGIPFGLQFFKLAKLSLMPFGAEIVYL